MAKSDEELKEIAINIGGYCELDILLHMVNAYMASNAISDMVFELIPPVAGASDPHWDFKYSYRKFKLEE